MNSKSVKAKGRRLQQEAAEAIKEALGFDEDDLKVALMSEKGTDVKLISERARYHFPFAVECKNTERLRIWAAIEQAFGHTDELYPLVVFRRNRGEPYCVLQFDVLLRLLKKLMELEAECTSTMTPD